MNDSDLCAHDLIPETCATCLRGPERAERLTVERAFTARYDGSQCRACNLPILKGQALAKLSNGSYVHNYEGCLP